MNQDKTRIMIVEDEPSHARMIARNLQIPIVALTANTLSGARENCLQTGMDGYLTRPINKSTLLDKLKTLGPPGLIS